MPKLDPISFGRRLLETGDLDPVYIILWEAELERWDLAKFLLAYWSFYHLGTCSWILSQPDYWKAMETAAASKDYPRGRERRHFRAKLATDSIQWLSKHSLKRLYSPMVGRRLPLKRVMGYVKTWHGFGDWIAFKVADMLERLDLSEISFDTGAVFMFDSPKKAARLMWSRYHGDETAPDNLWEWSVDNVLTGLGNLKAPPRYERVINLQEAETVLCKWGAYMNGHYRIGEDIEASKQAIGRFQVPLSKLLNRAGENLWRQL